MPDPRLPDAPLALPRESWTPPLAFLQDSAAMLAPMGSTATGQPDTATRPELPAALRTVAGVTEYRLKNGLTVLLGADAARPRVSVNLVFKVGSRHEGTGETGMAHLLEHMLFKGTARTPDPKQELTRRGMRWNATTFYDRTNYFAQFAASPENLDWMIGWLADITTGIRISPAKLDAERAIVLSEMRSGEDSARRTLFQQAMATAYQFHPYGRSVIGTRSDLDNVAPERLQSFYERYYRPDNAVLAISGQFDAPRVLAEVIRQFGSIERTDPLPPEPYTLEPVQEGERTVTLRREGGVPQMSVVWHIPPGASRDAVALEALIDILTREPEGALYRALVPTGIATQVGGFNLNTRDPGIASITVTLSDAGRRDEALDAISHVVEDLQPITEEDLQRVRQSARNSLRSLMDAPDSIALALTESVALGDWRLTFAMVDWIESLTVEDLRDVARRTLLRDNRTVATYLPTREPRRAEPFGRVDTDALLAGHPFRTEQAFDPDVALTPDSIRSATKHGTLAGSIRYAILPRRTRGDRVQLTLRLHWGDASSLRGEWDKADLMGSMLVAGTRSLPLQAWKDRLRDMDADLDIDGSDTGASIDLDVGVEQLDAALEVAIDALRRPALDPDLFEARRRAALAAEESRRSQPGTLVHERFLALDPVQWPEDDPRHSRTVDETVAALKRQTPERLGSFHEQWFGAGNAELAIVGPVDIAAVEKTLTRLLGDWNTERPWKRIVHDYQPLPAGVHVLQAPDKRNAVYTAVQRVAVSENDPDFLPLTLAIQMLGGDSSSRVGRRLREQEAISYGAYAGVTADRVVRGGSIAIRAILDPADLQRLHRALGEELARVLTDGFTQDELDQARTAIQERRRSYLASEANVADLLANNLFWNEDLDRWERIDARIAAMDLAAVNQALRKYLQPGTLTVVAAGDFPDRTLTPFERVELP